MFFLSFLLSFLCNFCRQPALPDWACCGHSNADAPNWIKPRITRVTRVKCSYKCHELGQDMPSCLKNGYDPGMRSIRLRKTQRLWKKTAPRLQTRPTCQRRAPSRRQRAPCRQWSLWLTPCGSGVTWCDMVRHRGCWFKVAKTELGVWVVVAEVHRTCALECMECMECMQLLNMASREQLTTCLVPRRIIHGLHSQVSHWALNVETCRRYVELSRLASLWNWTWENPHHCAEKLTFPCHLSTAK